MLQMVNSAGQGFGINIRNVRQEVAVDVAAMDMANLSYKSVDGADVRYKLRVNDGGSVTQTVHICNNTSRPLHIEHQVNLELSIHRASYGQLTEGGPIPLPQCENHLQVRSKDGAFTIRNKYLQAHISGALDINGSPGPLDGLINVTVPGVLRGSSSEWKSVTVAPNSDLTMCLTLNLASGLDVSSRGHLNMMNENKTGKEVTVAWRNPSTLQSYLVRRNVDYILANCVIPVSDTDVAIITDHVALPLGWNRDN